MEKKFKMMVDKVSFKNKPEGLTIGSIKERFKNSDHIVDVTVKELFDFCKKGYTISPFVAKGGLKSENFTCGQLIIVDIDNKDLSNVLKIEDAISILKENNFMPLGYHESFHHSENEPKYHIFLLLENEIVEPKKMSFAISIINSCLKYTDTSCTDLARIFFTTNGEEKKVKILDEEAVVTWDSILNYYNKNIENNDYEKKSNIRTKEIKQLEKKFDLLSYMKKDNMPIYGENSNSNYIMFDTCCICGHKKDLCYFKDSNMFKCFGANGNVGGTIIDYIMSTKNFNEKEATEYFLYEILKRPRESKTIDNNDIEELKKNHIEEITNNLMKLGIDFKNISEVDWLDYVYTKNGIIAKVMCPRLAKCIKEKIYFFFVETATDKNVLKYIYKNGVYKSISDNKFKGIINAFIPSDTLKIKDCEEIFKILCTESSNYISINKLNNNEKIINVKNGLYHVDTKELTKHTPNYYCTIQLNCKYIKDAMPSENKYFDNFITSFSNNNEDNKTFLCEYMAYTISNFKGNRTKCSLFIIGKPHSGKSKYIGITEYMLGEDNCTTLDISDFEKPFHSIKLLGKRLCSHADISGIPMKSLSKFKMITGGDKISDSLKGKDYIDFDFKGTLVFGGNHMPKWGFEKGDAILDRMIFFEPLNIIPKEKWDTDLLEHMEEEIDYIFITLLPYLDKVIENGYKYDIPNDSLILRKKITIDNDSVLTFINECMEQTIREPDSNDLTTGEVYQLYVKWCKYNNNNYYEANKSFCSTILEYTGETKPKKTHGGNTYYRYLIPTAEAIKTYWESGYKY